MLSIEDVKKHFENEFSFLSNKFDIIELNASDAGEDSSARVNAPGVYVFWHPKFGVIKVGKSQDNSKKRSLEHIRDNTSNKHLEMSSLKGNNDTKLLLFNIHNKSDIHWVLSLEAFFEWNIKPLINAARMG